MSWIARPLHLTSFMQDHSGSNPPPAAPAKPKGPAMTHTGLRRPPGRTQALLAPPKPDIRPIFHSGADRISFWWCITARDLPTIEVRRGSRIRIARHGGMVSFERGPMAPLTPAARNGRAGD